MMNTTIAMIIMITMIVKATIAALTEMRDAYTVAGLRGIPMSKVFNG